MLLRRRSFGGFYFLVIYFEGKEWDLRIGRLLTGIGRPFYEFSGVIVRCGEFDLECSKSNFVSTCDDGEV